VTCRGDPRRRDAGRVQRVDAREEVDAFSRRRIGVGREEIPDEFDHGAVDADVVVDRGVSDGRIAEQRLGVGVALRAHDVEDGNRFEERRTRLKVVVGVREARGQGDRGRAEGARRHHVVDRHLQSDSESLRREVGARGGSGSRSRRNCGRPRPGSRSDRRTRPSSPPRRRSDR
jgi:hypothetical protein